MEKESIKTQIDKLERERYQVMKDYHKIAQELDYIDYQLFRLKKQAAETVEN